MMTPMRTIIDLPQAKIEALRELCEKRHISRAEAVRQAVDRMLSDEASPPRTDIGFGIWKHKHIDSSKHVKTLRDEWGAK